MSDWRQRFADNDETKNGPTTLFVRRMPSVIWDSVPALVVPTPLIFTASVPGPPTSAPKPQANMTWSPAMTFAVLVIDLDYVKQELLPSLAERHFSQARSDGASSGPTMSRTRTW